MLASLQVSISYTLQRYKLFKAIERSSQQWNIRQMTATTNIVPMQKADLISQPHNSIDYSDKVFCPRRLSPITSMGQDIAVWPASIMGLDLHIIKGKNAFYAWISDFCPRDSVRLMNFLSTRYLIMLG